MCVCVKGRGSEGYINIVLKTNSVSRQNVLLLLHYNKGRLTTSNTTNVTKRIVNKNKRTEIISEVQNKRIKGSIK